MANELKPGRRVFLNIGLHSGQENHQRTVRGRLHLILRMLDIVMEQGYQIHTVYPASTEPTVIVRGFLGPLTALDRMVVHEALNATGQQCMAVWYPDSREGVFVGPTTKGWEWDNNKFHWPTGYVVPNFTLVGESRRVTQEVFEDIRRLALTHFVNIKTYPAEHGNAARAITPPTLYAPNPVDKPQGTVAGHHPVHTGLQKHSVSEAYPLSVVGYGHPTIYTVENVAKGEVACTVSGRVRQWQGAELAGAYLDDVVQKKGRLSTPTWLKGRPIRTVHNELSL